MLLLALLGCRCDPQDPPQDVLFLEHSVQEVGGRFYGQPDAPLDPSLAFDVQRRCPTIDRANLRQANADIHHLTLWGVGLDRVKSVSAALYDKNLATVQFRREGETLELPIACNRCEIYLGIDAGDRTAACIGPGYSISIRNGQIVP